MAIVAGISLDGSEGTISIVTDVATMILGALASWIGAFMTFGFGEVVDSTNKMAGK